MKFSYIVGIISMNKPWNFLRIPNEKSQYQVIQFKVTFSSPIVGGHQQPFQKVTFFSPSP